MQRRRWFACQPRAQTAIRSSLSLLGLLCGLFAGALQPIPARAGTARYFTETSHNVPELFATYWEAHGGIARYGLPLTEPYNEGGLTVQWFERARFERHPENKDTPYEVLLGQLGREMRGTDAPTIPVGGTSARFFPETGHNLALFRGYWERSGGLFQFGLPLSEEVREANTGDGQSYTVQYFERARLEHHPEKAGTPYEVALGLIGRESYERVKLANPVAATAGAPVPQPLVAAAPAQMVELTMWRTINADRVALGVAPLALDPLLSKAAAIHVADMSANDFIDHTGTDGSSPLDRMRRLGVQVRFGSENVSMECAKDPAIAVRNIQAWMMAEPYGPTLYNHHWNLINPGYSRIGIAFTIAKNGCWLMAETFADGEPSAGSQR